MKRKMMYGLALMLALIGTIVLAAGRTITAWTPTFTDTLWTASTNDSSTYPYAGTNLDTTSAAGWVVSEFPFNQIGVEIAIDSVAGARKRPADSIIVEARWNYKTGGMYSDWTSIRRVKWNKTDSTLMTTYGEIPDASMLIKPYRIEVRMIAKDDTAVASHTYDSSYTVTKARLIAG